MTINYLKKSPKTSSTDDTKTREIVQNLLKELENSKEEGCKELTKKFDKYEGEIIVSKEKIEEIKKNLKPDLFFNFGGQQEITVEGIGEVGWYFAVARWDFDDNEENDPDEVIEKLDDSYTGFYCYHPSSRSIVVYLVYCFPNELS